MKSDGWKQFPFNQSPWKAGLTGAVVAISVLGMGKLWAQAPHQTTRTALARSPGQPVPVVSHQELSRQSEAVQRSALRGTYLLLQYNPNLEVGLDLNDNGSVGSTGDREIQAGDLWQSDSSGHEISKIGKFTAVYDFQDISGQTTGTDLTETLDMLFTNGGQLRAGGYWNVPDGNNGFSTLGIESATGATTLRRYVTGQLLFMGKINNTEELYFLAR